MSMDCGMQEGLNKCILTSGREVCQESHRLDVWGEPGKQQQQQQHKQQHNPVEFIFK